MFLEGIRHSKPPSYPFASLVTVLSPHIPPTTPPYLLTQVYSFRQARATAGASPGIRAQANEILRRFAGVGASGSREAGGSGGGSGESKGEGAGRGGAQGGSTVISSEQLLDAVNDILGRANVSLSMEQGDRLREMLRLKGILFYFRGRMYVHVRWALPLGSWPVLLFFPNVVIYVCCCFWEAGNFAYCKNTQDISCCCVRA